MDTASSRPVKVITVLLAGLAVALSALLLYKSQTLEALPGCGGGSSCETVLTSRWSSWLGIPVSLPAMGIYTAMLAAVLLRDLQVRRPQRPAEWVMTFCGVATLVSALWFIAVQFGLVGAFCIYCMATHASAAAAAVLCLLAARPMRWVKGLASASAVAVGLVAVLIVGQIMGDEPEAAAPKVQFVEDVSVDMEIDFTSIEPVPLPNTMFNDPRIDANPSTPATPATASTNSASSDSPTAPRKLAFYGGRFKVDTTTVPIIGDPQAPTVLVILYDYTCVHCRETRKTLERTKKKHGDSLAILCLPAPLDKKCNKMLRSTNPTNRYACDLAEISLAVWRAAPDKWAEFDKKLYDNEKLLTPARAKITAWELIGGEKELKRGLDDPWVDQRIALNVRIYNAVSRAAGNSLMPILITRNAVMNGAPRHPLDIDDLLEGKKVNSKSDGHDGHGH
jgi:uncharacterized membrane protein